MCESRKAIFGLFFCSLIIVSVVGPNGAARGLPDFVPLVERVGPSVVSIQTQYGQQRSKTQRNEPSVGSGFAISGREILTNAHFITGANEIIVRTAQRREYPARVVGIDEHSDLALLRLENAELRPVDIGNPKQLKVGEWVMAIGSPFGFSQSVTAGIVSAKGRSIQTDQYVPFIQTDVATNPGNSGGPLLNLQGQVVAVNSRIFTSNGGYQGLSFSIPIDMAMKVARQLREKGRVSRAWLGVTVQEVERDLAASLGMEYPHGALVARVVSGSPAGQAGIRGGDIIQQLGDERIEHSRMLPSLVASLDADERTELTVIRQGQTVRLPVQMRELPQTAMVGQTQVAGAANAQFSADYQQTFSVSRSDAVLGLQVRDVRAEERRQYRLLHGGVYVEAVRGQSAREAGFKQGDFIQAVRGRQVLDQLDFEQLMAQLPSGRPVAIRIVRDGLPLFLALRVR